MVHGAAGRSPHERSDMRDRGRGRSPCQYCHGFRNCHCFRISPHSSGLLRRISGMTRIVTLPAVILCVAAAACALLASPAAAAETLRLAQLPPTQSELRIYAGLHAAAAAGDAAEIERLIAAGEKPD